MERIKFFWKDKPYETITRALTNIDGEWVNSIVYSTLYHNVDGDIFVKTEKDNEWEKFNKAISQGPFSANEEVKVNIRRSGRTTRMADAYIQELFDKESIIVRDHHSNTHLELFRIIIDRLKNEHRGTIFISDKTELKITLTKN